MSSTQPVKLNTILIVTGAPFDLDGLQVALADHGLRACTVSRGDSALEAVGAGGIALVLLDAAQAGSARFELCQRLVAASSSGTLPVLLMSAAPDDDEQERATLAGASGYLRLPFATADVVEKILIELTVHHAWPAAQDTLDPDALEIHYHTLLAGSPDSIMLFDAEHGHPIDINHSAEKLFGRSAEQLRTMRLEELCPPFQPDGRPSAQAVQELIRKVLGGEIRVFPMSFRHSGGNRVDCEIRLVMLNKDNRRLYHMRLVDVSGHRLAEALRVGQNKLLEMIARGAPLRDTLDRLMLLIEAQSPGVLCSTLLLDSDGCTMRTGAGPSLPADYMAAIDGIRIGPTVGSCGTAMYRKETVIASDIQSDPLWAPYAPVAAAYGLRACWSMPILLDEDTILGTFAMYFREVRSPSADDQRLTGVATHLAGIAIARTRHEEELLRHRGHLEELVAARTAELLRAKEQAELANEELATALENLSMTQDELVRRDKLAALGALVAGVAHELNTPIGNSLVVAGAMAERTRMLRQETATGLRRSTLENYLEQAGEANDIMLRNLDRAASLVTSFKQIAVDTDSTQRRRFHLDHFIAELVLPLHATVKHARIEVRQAVAPDLELDSYPGPLGQALGNLFENAIVHGFAGRANGRIEIRAARAGNGDIELSLADDGVGIPPEHQGKIYDPFFTTKLGSGGSGLGLYVTHNIVTGVLGGRIDVGNAPDGGAVFTMRLPAVAPL
ncbi:MAG: ATP-binding protein [Pseudomonadota bacterium]